MDSIDKTTPLPATTTSFIDDVIDALKPWNGTYSRDDILKVVSQCLNLIRDCHNEHFAREVVKHTRDNAREIAKLTERMKRKLIRARPEITLRLNVDQSLSDLDRITQACQLAENEALAEGRKDQTKEWCAKIAWFLLARFSAMPATIQRMMKVAPLLYEAATHRKATDLKRACEAYIKFTRSLPQNVDNVSV